MSTLIAQYVPKERFGRSMAFIRLAINLGFSAGPAVGGFLAVTLGYQWLFWIDGLTCILAALFFLVISRQWTVVRTRKKDQRASGQVLSAPVYKNRAFIFFIVSTVLMAFTFVQWFHTVPVFLKTDWGFDERVYGMMMGISSLIIVLVEMPLIHYIEENGYKRKALQWGLILLGGSFVAFQFPGALFFCTVAMLFFTFGEILYLPLNNSFSLLLSSDDRRGEYMSWYWMSWSIANILGPSMGFLLIAQLGYAFFWAFLLLLLAGSFLLNYKVAK